MNKSLVIALVLIVAVVAVLLNNSTPIKVDFFVNTFQQKQSLIFLGFYVTGMITGLLLKGQ